MKGEDSAASGQHIGNANAASREISRLHYRPSRYVWQVFKWIVLIWISGLIGIAEGRGETFVSKPYNFSIEPPEGWNRVDIEGILLVYRDDTENQLFSVMVKRLPAKNYRVVAD